uniref:MCBG protein (Microcin resistance protein)-like protein n=1 Tax=Chlorobium chlorochromatii (strain CaD3) TaxID=340177 RepID=Q3AR20_CHLCH
MFNHFIAMECYQQTFEKKDFYENPLTMGTYEECHFHGCTFINVDLSHYIFINCTFDGCDLSMVKLNNTSLQEVLFCNCKLLGVPFSDCRQLLLSFRLERCMARLALFCRLKLKGSLWSECMLQEADFSEADLSNALFERCEFPQATFFHTNLEGADFRTSWHYSINPATNRVRKARFSLAGIAGLLESFDVVIE